MSTASGPTPSRLPIAGWLADDGRIATHYTKTESMPTASQESYSIALVRESDAMAALANMANLLHALNVQLASLNPTQGNQT